MKKRVSIRSIESACELGVQGLRALVFVYGSTVCVTSHSTSRSRPTIRPPVAPSVSGVYFSKEKGHGQRDLGKVFDNNLSLESSIARENFYLFLTVVGLTESFEFTSKLWPLTTSIPLLEFMSLNNAF
ncbi:hypothetical protein Tco_0952147 [Tanacetum coccineum]|uniref:Uncharacterized protein n=1 Tax=Tanacetum coccineum TaxID=301880 RepID=A0ABQ5DWZ5_9ASTR